MQNIICKLSLFNQHSRTASMVVWRRSFNMKKMLIDVEKNPHLKRISEEQMKKREKRGTFQRLIEKRTTEYKEYFARSPDPSIIKRPRHVSYDHVGQKRALYLTKVLRAFITDRIGSGEVGDILSTKNFQLTNIVVPVDLNRIEILWWSPEEEVTQIEDLLKTAGEEIKTAIRHAQLLPSLPPVLFKRDLAPNEREKINHLLDTADTGEVDPTTTLETPERTDLYDSDRTVILRKLSKQPVIDAEETTEESTDGREMTVEQMQRRMKAFALTKRMKTMEKQRSAIDGLMAIEKERAERERFSLTDTNQIEHETLPKNESMSINK